MTRPRYHWGTVSKRTLKAAAALIGLVVVGAFIWSLRADNVDPGCDDICPGDREGEALFGGIYIIAAIVGIAALIWVSELGAYLGWRLSREHGLRDGQLRGIWRLAPPVGALVLVALLVMTLASAFGP